MNIHSIFSQALQSHLKRTGLSNYAVLRHLKRCGHTTTYGVWNTYLDGTSLPRRRWDSFILSLTEILSIDHPSRLFNLSPPRYTGDLLVWPEPLTYSLSNLDISAYSVARALDIPRVTFYSWIHGNLPSLPTLYNISDYLGTPFAALLPTLRRDRDLLTF